MSDGCSSCVDMWAGIGEEGRNEGRKNGHVHEHSTLSSAQSPPIPASSSSHAFPFPRSYVRWISDMASMEPRLLTALRLVRLGEIRYGIDTGHNHILGAYCREIGLPERLADMRRARLPCVIVHGGQPGGCEVHAAKRWAEGFWKAWKVSLRVFNVNDHCFSPYQTVYYSLIRLTLVLPLRTPLVFEDLLSRTPPPPSPLPPPPPSFLPSSFPYPNTHCVLPFLRFPRYLHCPHLVFGLHRPHARGLPTTPPAAAAAR